MRRIALPVLLATTLMAASAAAQGPGGDPGQGGGGGGGGGGRSQPTPEQRFKQFDADSDGRITHQEFMAYSELQWARMLQRIDTNHDGNVSRDEFVTAPRGNKAPPRQ